MDDTLKDLKLQDLIDTKEELANWCAEVAILWVLYYYHGGPEPEPNAMWRKIALAQRLKPENEWLDALVAQIRAGSEQH